jgi:hypothetical protein
MRPERGGDWVKAKRLAMAVVGSVIFLVWGLPALAASPQSGSFSGGTSQPGGAVAFTVPASGGEVLDFEAGVVATCEKAGAPTAVGLVKLTPAPSISIVAGKFNFSDEFSLGDGSQSVGHGIGEVRGSFISDRVVSGSMRFPWDVTDGVLRGYHCDTGVVTFRATAPAPPPGGSSRRECVVPVLKGRELKAAKRAILRSGCGVGKVLHRRSGRVAAGRVMGQRPRPGTRRGAAAPVKVVVSRGPSHRR